MSGSVEASKLSAISHSVWPLAVVADLGGEGFVEACLQPNESTGKAFERFGLPIAERDGVEQFVERHVAFLLQRAGVGQVALADPDGVDDDEAVLAFDAGIDLLHLGFGMTRTPCPSSARRSRVI